MKKLICGLAAFLLAASPLSTTEIMAQEVKYPTLEDLIPGGETYRYTENLYGLQWWGDVCIRPDIDEVKAVDPGTGRESVLFTREQANEALRKAGAPELRHLYGISLPWAGKTQVQLPQAQRYAVYNWQTGEVTLRDDLPKEPYDNQDLHAESGQIAYTVGNNLYVNGVRVTDEPAGVVCGTSVHRNEFGISKGTFWSPKGTLLAFYRMDESMVTEYPLVDIDARVAELTPIRYPMAGMESHRVQVGIYNPRTQKTVYLNTGDPTDRYFTNIAWSPDERSLYLIELNRDQNHALLCRYNAETGEPDGVLYEEMHPKYVEPMQPIAFLPWDETKFIYQSQRDGFNHLYLFDLRKTVDGAGWQEAAAGGKYKENLIVRQLTTGDWQVDEILGYNAKRKEIVFGATDMNGSNIFSVNAVNGKCSQPLNLGIRTDGEHRGVLSPSGNYLIDYCSAPDLPRRIDLINTRTRKSINLLVAKNPYEGLRMPSIETGILTAADGKTPLRYRIVKPADFDPSKRYPAIIYVYGGPHAQLVTNGWMTGARGWDLYMANRGYIMFTLDNRGSANRGLEFENVTFRHLGIEEGKDQVKGVEFLKSLPYVDGERIGVHGWSFGGHMTTALMLRYPDLFKVGVAGGPVIDWSYYEVMYGERYMDTPQSNPEGYEETNLKNLAGNLKGHLLIIHDYQDNTCVPQHALSFIKACVDARTYPDLFIYPGHQHNVLGRDRVHLHEKITRYFDDYLK